MFSNQTPLQCPLCTERYDLHDRLPRVLPQCGHTYCSLCITKIFASDNSICPTDQQPVSSQYQKTELCPPNLLAKQFLEGINGYDFCETHHMKKEVACFTDKSLMCAHCALFGGHRDHTVKHIMDIRAQFQIHSKELEILGESLDKYHKEAVNILEERRLGIQKTIQERFEELNFLLKMKKLGLLQELDIIFCREIKKLSTVMGNNSPLREKIIKRMDNYKEMPKNEGLFKLLEEDITSFKDQFDSKVMNKQIEEFNKAMDKALGSFSSSLLSQVTKISEVNLPSTQEMVEKSKLLSNKQEESLEEEEEEEEETLTVTSTNSKSPYVKINSCFVFETCNGYLDITTTGNEATDIILDIEDWIKIKEVRIKLEKFNCDEEDAKVLEYIWKLLKNLRCVRVDASFQKNLQGENLKMIFSTIFSNPESLREIELNFNESQFSNEELLYLSETIFPYLTNLKVVSLNFNSTEVTEIAISLFAKNALSKWKMLESFILYIGNTIVLEEAFLDLFIEMPNLGHYELGCSCTSLSDTGLKAFAEKTLASMGSLKRLKMRLWKTKVTDEGVSCLFEKMPDLKTFTLDLGSNDLSDKSVEELVRTKLPSMKSLKNFKLYLYDTHISEQMISHIYQIKQSLST